MSIKQILSEMVDRQLNESYVVGDTVTHKGAPNGKNTSTHTAKIIKELPNGVFEVRKDSSSPVYRITKRSIVKKLGENTQLTEKAAKIACLKCDEVSTEAAWKKNGGFCPKCKVSNQGVAESVELDEGLKMSYAVVDTADNNKVVAMASDEKDAKRSISTAEMPPMHIKDKKTLKIIKLKKSANIGDYITEATALASRAITEAIYNMLGGKRGVTIPNKIAVGQTQVTGILDTKEMGPMSEVFDKVTFEVKIEKAPDGSDNYIIWDLNINWQYIDGGWNGWSDRKNYVGVFGGKVTAKNTKENILKMAKKYGW